MPSDALRQEIRSLAKRAVFLNIAAYLVSIPVLGVTLSFALGLMLGTSVLVISLILLKNSVTRMAEDAKRSGVTSQRRYLLFYALRLAVFGIAFGGSVVLRQHIHPVAVVLPMLYPRLIYTAGALFSRPDVQSPKKRGEK